MIPKLELKVPENEMSVVETRWLTPDDWKIYRDLRLEAIKEEPYAFGTSFGEEKDHPEKIWRERVENTLFAFYGGQPVGLIGHIRQARIKQRHIVHIVGFFVKDEFKGLGIGEMLLRDLIEKISTYPDVTKISLGVVSTQKRAMKLYRKYGFEVVGVLKKELRVGDFYYDQILMEKFY